MTVLDVVMGPATHNVDEQQLTQLAENVLGDGTLASGFRYRKSDELAGPVGSVGLGIFCPAWADRHAAGLLDMA